MNAVSKHASAAKNNDIINHLRASHTPFSFIFIRWGEEHFFVSLENIPGMHKDPLRARYLRILFWDVCRYLLPLQPSHAIHQENYDKLLLVHVLLVSHIS